MEQTTFVRPMLALQGSLFALIFVNIAHAGVFKTGPAYDGRYTSLADQPRFDSVAALNDIRSLDIFNDSKSDPNGGNVFGSGVLIGPHTLLTSAHNLFDTEFGFPKALNEFVVSFGGNWDSSTDPTPRAATASGIAKASYKVLSYEVYPEWARTKNGPDLAVVQIASLSGAGVTGITPAVLNTNQSELGVDPPILIDVGYGIGKATGESVYSRTGVKRAGLNVVNSLRFELNQSVIRQNWGGGNSLSSNFLSYLPSKGDSGGPVFEQFNDGLKVVGIISNGSRDLASSKIGLGDWLDSTRVASYADWILQQRATYESETYTPLPGFNFSNPLLPNAPSPIDMPLGTKTFSLALLSGGIIYVDPSSASGYEFRTKNGQTFSGIDLPNYGDNLYELEAWDPALQQWVSWGSIAGGGLFNLPFLTNDIRVTGIEQHADSFVTGLRFSDGGPTTVYQIPLGAVDVPQSSVPEPSTYGLVGVFGAIGLIARRKILGLRSATAKALLY